MVGKEGDGAREHSNLMLAPLDALNELCSRALALNEYARRGERYEPPQVDDPHEKRVDEQIRDAYGALDAVSCTVVAEPGDAVLFSDSVYHRTQDMRAQARVALIADAVAGTWSGLERINEASARAELSLTPPSSA